MKKFGEGQQPFHAIIDIPEGDSQELTTVTDQALNSLYGELFNLLATHGINPTATTNADLKQVTRAVWSSAATGPFFVDSGTADVKNLTHIKKDKYLFKDSVYSDDGFIIEFVNKVTNNGQVKISVFDVEKNINHFDLVSFVDSDGNELTANYLLAGTFVKARYDQATNKFYAISVGNMASFSSGINGLGDALIAVLQPFLGAVKRTQHQKNTERVSVLDFGAFGDGIADDSQAIQKALNSNAKLIDGCGLTYKINSTITIQPYQSLKNIKLVAGVAGMNMVHVNNGSKLLDAILVGTGTLSKIERGVYPALDGVSDVVINADISNLTVGVHIQPLVATANITPQSIPRRWLIEGLIHDIVGTVGASEGYGVLCSPALNCKITANFFNIARHAVYLSAGASYNYVNCNVDGCGNIAVQLYASANQLPVQFNAVNGNFTNIKTTGNYNNTAAVGIIGNANFNLVEITANNTECNHAIMLEGVSGSPYPKLNTIKNCKLVGNYSGNVISVLNADSTEIYVNSIFASWKAGAAIALNTAGVADVASAGRIENNNIEGNGGTTTHGIYNAYNAPYFIGINDIKNITGQNIVDYSDLKKRLGNSKIMSGKSVTDTIQPNGYIDTVIDLPQPVTAASRKVFVSKTANTGTDFTTALDYYVLSETDSKIKIRFANKTSEVIRISFNWLITGD